jgi:dolichol kinase
VTPELWLSFAKILGSVALLAAVLFGVSQAGRRFKLQPEISRKLIHVSLGLYCLTFPAVFQQTWEVATVCALAIGVFMLVRAGPMRAFMGEGLHGVQRISHGEILFAVSVLLLFHLKDGHWVLEHMGLQNRPQPILYLLPILVLTLCDAACAVVGSNYGRARFQVESGIKSWEGVAVFVVTAWLLSLIALLLFSDTPPREAIVLAFITAGFGALLEAASWRGLDNLFIPLGLYFMLANLMPPGLTVLLAASALFIFATLLLLVLAERVKANRHVVAAGATLFFCIAIFSGPASLLGPLAVVVAYLFVARQRARVEAHDALSLILTILGLALAFFAFSDLARVDTIFAFNVSFAALAVALLARFGRATALGLVAACAAAWAVACVRIVGLEGARADTLPFAGLALALVVLACAVARLLLRRWEGQPWAKLGALSFIAGAVALPWSPA